MNLLRNRSARSIWSFLLPVLMVVVISFSSGFFPESIAMASSAAEQQSSVASSDGVESESMMASLPAPKLKRSDYPNIGTSSRAIVWIFAQMHLFFGALVLAVPIFVLVIELIGFKTNDDRYDDMAHEFMKVSLTAYAITALFGGTLALSLFLLYPQFMTYMMQAFGSQVLVYAVLFFLESILLYIYLTH